MTTPPPPLTDAEIAELRADMVLRGWPWCQRVIQTCDALTQARADLAAARRAAEEASMGERAAVVAHVIERKKMFEQIAMSLRADPEFSESANVYDNLAECCESLRIDFGNEMHVDAAEIEAGRHRAEGGENG